MTTEDPAEIGLMLNYMLVVAALASQILFSSSNLAKSASSIERLYDYAFWKEHEEPFDKPVPNKGKDWLSEGGIKGRNLKVRYRDGLPLVLDGIDFDFLPGQKVGVVGRTGSGKSTMLLALMRILEIPEEEGEAESYIEIDGQRIDKIGLHYLRRGIAIIP